MASTYLPPLFLNQELMHRAVSVYHCQNNDNIVKLNIIKCAFKLSSVSGENFCSDIYIAEVQYELNGRVLENSFIFKIILPEIAELTSNEAQMYKTVLPQMEECLKAIQKEECGSKLSARCLISERGDQEYYVLENLNTLGYFCEDRCKGLDKDHACLLMGKLGQFHAASMVYAKKHPDVINNLNKSHFEHGATDFVAQSIAFGGFRYVSQMIESWPGYDHLPIKLKNIITNFNNLVEQAVDPNNALFNVLNHGDVWVNNLLYKTAKERKTPVDVLFVDFQNTFWGGCGFDINWFLHTSLELKVLKDKRMELIQCYYNKLSRTLEEALYPQTEIPTWNQVLAEVERNEIIGLYVSLCELPIVACQKDISKDFTLACFKDEEKIQKLRLAMYANERVRDTHLYTLKYFESIGIL